MEVLFFTDEVRISKRLSSSTNCEIFSPLAPEIWASEKAAFEWVETPVPFSPFVGQSSPNLVGMYNNDGSLQRRFRLTIACSSPEIFAIKSQNRSMEN